MSSGGIGRDSLSRPVPPSGNHNGDILMLHPFRLQSTTISHRAPLLLAQICRQWREVALHTPALWRCLVFGNEMPVEFFHIWLSVLEIFPYPSTAGMLLKRALCLRRAWRIPTLAGCEIYDLLRLIPETEPNSYILAYASQHFHRCFLVDQRTNPRACNNTGCPNPPRAHLSTPPQLKFDIPWPQLTTLTLCHTIDLMECIHYFEDAQTS
ncbi:hypothetical protein B0H19DRAFT_447529 [Mycena capillaripes]|nr:hypothetical protein B0H19DRAFT_446991 [Mycena capillaripes]KAJ6533133.1 hypothetical protein B0H19DRAFT_447529 [Mycena capillaripes]